MGIDLNQIIGKRELEEDEFLTVEETAKRHRTSPPVLYRWIAEKRYPENVVFRIGRKILINRKNLEAFEKQGGTVFRDE